MFIISSTNLALLITLASHALAGLKGHSFSLMPLGDSITSGVGSSDGNGYRGDLLFELQKSGAQVTFVGSQKNGNMKNNDNEGHPGFTIDQIHDAAQSAYKHGYKPEVILLHAGTNDCNSWTDIPNVGNRLAKLTLDLTNWWPQATVILASIIATTHRDPQVNVDILNKRIPGIVTNLAKQGKRVVHADMSHALLAADMSDWLHPNRNGYRKMAHVWYAALHANSGNGWY